MFRLMCFLLFVVFTESLETCRQISISGLGAPDGIYTAVNDYRGRPDFFDEDNFFNLYGEIQEDDVIYWNLDNVVGKYPFFFVEDSAYNPVDIEGEWYIVRENLVPLTVYPEFVCVFSKTNARYYKTIIISCISSTVAFLLVVFHVFIRKIRLNRVANSCPICEKRRLEVNKAVTKVSL